MSTQWGQFCRPDNERVAKNLVRAAQTLTQFLIYFFFRSQNRALDFGYDEDDLSSMHSEVLAAVRKWFEVVQTQLPPTTYQKNGNTIPYNFVNTRSCNYSGDSMPALLRAGVKTNRENEDEGEKNQKTPKNLAKRHTMRGQLTGEQILRKWEESSRVRTQTESGFRRDLKRARKAEEAEREKEKPRELRTKMLEVVAMPIKDIMKQGTASDFDVDTFVPSNVWATDDALAAEADHMDRLEDDIDADAPGATPTFAEAGAEEDADAEGGDTDIDDGADVEEDPIQVELTPLELQIEEEGVNMVTHE